LKTAPTATAAAKAEIARAGGDAKAVAAAWKAIEAAAKTIGRSGWVSFARTDSTTCQAIRAAA
jgi:hypothetical protein